MKFKIGDMDVYRFLKKGARYFLVFEKGRSKNFFRFLEKIGKYFHLDFEKKERTFLILERGTLFLEQKISQK